MNLTIRSYHWFFALILSGLAHGWLIYSLQLFKQEPVEVERVEIPFTVLLADKEVIEQVELEKPETARSAVIPLVWMRPSSRRLKIWRLRLTSLSVVSHWS